MSSLARLFTGRFGVLAIGVTIVLFVVGIDQLLRALDPSAGFIERIQFAKFRAEFRGFYREIVVLNGPRYREPAQWPRLWIDFWNSLFACHYTLGHLVGIGLPVYFLAVPIRRLLIAGARGRRRE